MDFGNKILVLFIVILFFPHLFSFPVTFMVYFSPTQVTFVSNPEENPIWYPIEKAKAANNNAKVRFSRKSSNVPEIFQNFSMASPFLLVSGYFTLLLPGYDPFMTARKSVLDSWQYSRQ